MVQPTTVEVQRVGDARDGRVGVADRRPEEQRAAAGDPLERGDALLEVVAHAALTRAARRGGRARRSGARRRDPPPSDGAHHLGVLLGLSPDDEECRLRAVRREELEHPLRPARVRPVVERERHAARAARPAYDRVGEDAQPQDEDAPQQQRHVRGEREDRHAGRRRAHEQRARRHHEQPRARQVKHEPGRRHLALGATGDALGVLAVFGVARLEDARLRAAVRGRRPDALALAGARLTLA